MTKLFGLVLLVGTATASFLRGAVAGRTEGAEIVSPSAPSSTGIRIVPDEYPTIQSAIDAAMQGDTVLVRPGVYSERISMGWKPIRVIGEGGSTRTFLTTDGKSGPIVRIDGARLPNIEFRGFDILGARGTNGVGLLLADSTLAIIDCVFEQNEEGGVRHMGGAASFTNCIFRDNTGSFAGAGASNEGGDPVFLDCQFEGNVSNTFGGAFYNRAGTATFSNTVFDRNATRNGAYGGGIYSDSGEIRATDCVINRNRAIDAGGAAYLASGSGQFIRCSFAGNVANEGWTIASANGTAQLIGSTICGSDAPHATSKTVVMGDTIFSNACFADCNRNGVDDLEEIALGTAADTDGNMVPDGCDADCNGNGIIDAVEVRRGWRSDCNGNGILDSCEIEWGTELDEDGDGRIDGCKPTPEFAYAGS
ncbi:MAG: right-handed parallel beta-helix repeat-containing protein [Planctomycetota bacterium]|nr:right-handed parallel beta-helix repeat-containing protein [Planctomycetota bacterium]